LADEKNVYRTIIVTSVWLTCVCARAHTTSKTLFRQDKKKHKHS